MSYNPYTQQPDTSSTGGGGGYNISTDIIFSSSTYNQIEWTQGIIAVSGGQTFQVNAGSATFNTLHFIYYDGTTLLKISTDPSEAQAANNIVLGSLTPSEPGKKAMFKIDGSPHIGVFIDGNMIKAGSITANEINVENLFAQEIEASGSITGASFFSSTYIPGGNSGWNIDEGGFNFRGDETLLRETSIREGLLSIESLTPGDQSRIRLLPTSLSFRSSTGNTSNINILGSEVNISNLRSLAINVSGQGILQATNSALEFKNNIIPEIDTVDNSYTIGSPDKAIRIKIGNSFYWIPCIDG